MIDSLFSAALAFCLLIGGTIAIGTALQERGLPSNHAARATQVQQREAATLSRTKPATLVATDNEASQPTALR